MYIKKCSWYTEKMFVVIETKKKEEFKKKEKIPGKNQPRRTESKKGKVKWLSGRENHYGI